MLEIKSCVDKQTILPYCKARKIVYSEALYLYRAVSYGKVIAAGLFEVKSDQVDVLYYSAENMEDVYLFDAILRAGLNYASSFGIALGHIPQDFWKAHIGLFHKLNFPLEHTFDISNFFDKYKNCRITDTRG